MLPLIVSEFKGSCLSYEYIINVVWGLFCNGLAKYKGLRSVQYD